MCRAAELLAYLSATLTPLEVNPGLRPCRGGRRSILPSFYRDVERRNCLIAKQWELETPYSQIIMSRRARRYKKEYALEGLRQATLTHIRICPLFRLLSNKFI